MSIFKFKTKYAVSAVLSCVMLCSCMTVRKPQTEEMFAFDTYVSITSYDPSDNGAKELLAALDEEFSQTYTKNANAINGENILKCADICREWNSEFGDLFGESINFTCGALTKLWGISGEAPHVPNESELSAALETITDENTPFSLMPSGTMLDFGASAKGFACDKAKALLDASGAKCEIISLGSSTLLYGAKPDGSSFKAAVKDPLTPSSYLGTIETDAAFISTSGGYERYFEENGIKYEHILSPQTGMPVETDLCSVTVIASADIPNGGIYTDLLATAIYSGGTSVLTEFMEQDNDFGDAIYGIVAADKNNNVYVSSGVDFTLYESSGFRLKENL